MRFNEKELASLSLEDADFEGRLNYRKTPSGNFSHSNSGFKERWFKLKYNLLFYFKINELGKIEDKPAGVFVLESAHVQLELSGAQFAFSITFGDDADKKHIFAAMSETQVYSWVNILKKSTYESLRHKLIMLQEKLNRITGLDPLLMYPRNKGTVRSFDHRSVHQQTSSFVKASFQSHLRFADLNLGTNTKPAVPEVNLIEL